MSRRLEEQRDELERECAALWSRLQAGLESPAARQEAFDAMAQRLARKLSRLKAVRDRLAARERGGPGHVA